jgi:hypothetical protein
MMKFAKNISRLSAQKYAGHKNCFYDFYIILESPKLTRTIFDAKFAWDEKELVILVTKMENGTNGKYDSPINLGTFKNSEMNRAKKLIESQVECLEKAGYKVIS